MANLKKIYPADTSFTRFSGSLFSEERGRLLETIICNGLKRKNRDIFYWKNDRGKEVDFVVCDGLKPVSLIQVCERIETEKVMKRETDPMFLAADELKISDLILLTDTLPDLQIPSGISVTSVLNWLVE
jgi:predicted AAA+ superfamily ATPase